VFREVIDDSRSAELFECLYSVPSPPEHKGLPFLSFIWGGHPTGFYTLEPNSAALSVEEGCALHFAQDVRGMVFAIIYPFHSPLHETNEKYLLYAAYHEPAQVTASQVRRAIMFMFSMAQTTSFCGHPTLADWLRMAELQLRTRVYRIQYQDVAKYAMQIGIKLAEKAVRIS
jgi:hypothetical protein